MHRAFQRLILAGAAFALPLSASAHGSEFLVAKAMVQTDGRVLLEVTADYGDNPMIANEDEAAAAVRSSLRPVGGVAAIGEPRLEKRSQPDPDSPLPPDPMMMGKPHQLLTAVWQIKPATDSIHFEVPSDAGQTVILWTKDSMHPEEKAKWAMLVPGEQSPPISVSHMPPVWMKPVWLALGGILLPATLWVILRRPRLQRPVPALSA